MMLPPSEIELANETWIVGIGGGAKLPSKASGPRAAPSIVAAIWLICGCGGNSRAAIHFARSRDENEAAETRTRASAWGSSKTKRNVRGIQGDRVSSTPVK